MESDGVPAINLFMRKMAFEEVNINYCDSADHFLLLFSVEEKFSFIL